MLMDQAVEPDSTSPLRQNLANQYPATHQASPDASGLS